MKGAHTPGPWQSGFDLRVLATDDRATVVCQVSGAPTNPVARADARLIAAAPDLLDAARLTVLHFQRTHASGGFQGDDEHEAWAALNAAIAKAEGR